MNVKDCLYLRASCDTATRIFRNLHVPLDIQITINEEIKEEPYGKDIGDTYSSLVLMLVDFNSESENSPNIDINNIFLFVENESNGAFIRFTNYTSPFITTFQLINLNYIEDDAFGFEDIYDKPRSKNIRITFSDFMQEYLCEKDILIDRNLDYYGNKKKEAFTSPIKVSIGYFDLFGFSKSISIDTIEVPYITPFCMFGECTIKMTEGIIFFL